MRRLLIALSALVALTLPATAGKPRRAEPSFIFFHDRDNTTMSGDLSDLKRVKKALQVTGRVLWVRTPEGKEFVIRDAGVLDQFEAVWKPVNALGAAQGALGEKQGALGEKQGALGEKQGELGTRQGDLSTELADDDTSAKRRKAIERELRDIDRQMRELGAQMRELDKPMRELGAQIDALGKKLDAASKQANADSEALIARAIASGAAKPL